MHGSAPAVSGMQRKLFVFARCWRSRALAQFRTHVPGRPLAELRPALHQDQAGRGRRPERFPVEKQPPYPGDWKTEVRIKSYIRWNAMAMVVNANAKHDGLGGHISTFASSATLYEVAFNHFFRGRHDDFDCRSFLAKRAAQ